MKRIVFTILVFVFCCGFLGIGSSWHEEYNIWDKRELKYIDVLPKLLRALHSTNPDHVMKAAHEMRKFGNHNGVFDELHKASLGAVAKSDDDVKWQLISAMFSVYRPEFGPEKINDILLRSLSESDWEMKMTIIEEIDKNNIYNKQIEQKLVEIVEATNKIRYTSSQVDFVVIAMDYLIKNNKKENRNIDKAILSASSHKHGRVRLKLFSSIAKYNYYSSMALNIVETIVIAEREKSVKEEALAAMSKLKILSFARDKKSSNKQVVAAKASSKEPIKPKEKNMAKSKIKPKVAKSAGNKVEKKVSGGSQANNHFSKSQNNNYFEAKSGIYNPYGIAVIIGNKSYMDKGKNVPDVDYAHNDAEAMYQYVTKVLGFRRGNVIYLKDAPQSELVSVFGNEKSYKGRLYNWVRPEVSDVFVFYSGHGAPSLKNGKGYLLPVDSNPGTVELNGYPLDMLYANLEKVPAKSKTLIIDACFSGGSQGGSLVKNASSISLKTIDVSKRIDNTNILTAAGVAEVASWDTEAEHGLFTGHLIQAIKGAADKEPYGNGDKRVDLAEVKKYIGLEVPYMARRLYGRDQNPQIDGNEKFIFTELTQ